MRKIITLISLIAALCINAGAILWEGVTGEDVAEVQRRLSASGCYNGPWDGVYSHDVAEAVKKYQRMNNLFEDGICSYPLACKMGADVAYDPDEADMIFLAYTVSYLCGDADHTTKLTVASVAYNRLASPYYPDDMYGVMASFGNIPATAPSPDHLRAVFEASLGAKPYGDTTVIPPKVAQSLRHSSDDPRF